jgi:hypothetical protein
MERLADKTVEELRQIREDYLKEYIGDFNKPFGYETKLKNLDRLIVAKLITNYQKVANSNTSSDDELIDSANAIPLYLYDNGYDPEQNDELMDYLLRATDAVLQTVFFKEITFG